MAALFNIPLARLTHFFIVEAANAFKFSIRRQRPAGGPGERDVFGCQQYGPLFDLEIQEMAE